MTSATRPPTAERRPPEGLPELPQGWVWTTLGKVANVRGGVTKGRDLSRFETIEAPYLRVANVQVGYLDLREVKTITIKRDELAKYQLRYGDVLFTEGGDRDKLARGTVWRDEIAGCIHQNHIFCARPYLTDILPEWLSLASQLPASREYFWSVASQTVNLASISLTNLKAWPIPLPPLAEQRRIVERVEALLAQARTAREALAPLPALVRRLRQSVLAAAFSGRLSKREPGDEPAGELLERISAERALLGGRRGREEARVLPEGLPELPEGWAWSTLDELSSKITSGSRDWKTYYGRGTGTFILAQNVRMGKLDLSFRQAVDPPPGNRDRARSQVEKDDLLITIVGANTGDVCRIPEALSEHYVCQSVALVRLFTPELARFIELYLTADNYGQRQFLQFIYGAGRPHLSFDDLKLTVVPVPPMNEQGRIVARVEALLAQADVIERAVAAVSQRVADVERAVLARAFRGELVSEME